MQKPVFRSMNNISQNQPCFGYFMVQDPSFTPMLCDSSIDQHYAGRRSLSCELIVYTHPDQCGIQATSELLNGDMTSKYTFIENQRIIRLLDYRSENIDIYTLLTLSIYYVILMYFCTISRSFFTIYLLFNASNVTFSLRDLCVRGSILLSTSFIRRRFKC